MLSAGFEEELPFPAEYERPADALDEGVPVRGWNECQPLPKLAAPDPEDDRFGPVVPLAESDALSELELGGAERGWKECQPLFVLAVELDDLSPWPAVVPRVSAIGRLEAEVAVFAPCSEVSGDRPLEADVWSCEPP
jgi:hypothetical protein